MELIHCDGPECDRAVKPEDAVSWWQVTTRGAAADVGPEDKADLCSTECLHKWAATAIAEEQEAGLPFDSAEELDEIVKEGSGPPASDVQRSGV